MLDADHYDDLRDFLNSCIVSIKKSLPNLSANQLAQRVNVSSSSFGRIKNRQIKSPSFNIAMNIARAACGEQKLQAFIGKFYPEMLEKMARVYPGNANVKFVAPEVEHYFQDQSTFELVMMATSDHGVTKEEVLATFGSRGLKVIDNLVAKGIINATNGRFCLKENINWSQETIQKLFQNLISKSYDVSAFGNKLNWMSTQYESVDAEKVSPILYAIMKRAGQEIREAFTSPENKGKDVMWAGLVMDTLVKEDSEQSATDEKGPKQ